MEMTSCRTNVTVDATRSIEDASSDSHSCDNSKLTEIIPHFFLKEPMRHVANINETPIICVVCVQLGADHSRPCAALSAISALRQLLEQSAPAQCWQAMVQTNPCLRQPHIFVQSFLHEQKISSKMLGGPGGPIERASTGTTISFPSSETSFNPERSSISSSSDSVDLMSGFQHHQRGQRFIKFALATGYKDTPEMEEENGNEQQPLLRRTTAIHRAARYHSPINHTAIGELFKAYDRYDANYIDEWGYTHFHAACEYGFVDVVEKFLDAGQDPDCRLVATATPKSIVDPPLHLALAWGYKDAMASLLRRGADANSLNQDGLTALQMICQGYRHLHLLKIFRVDPDKYQPLPVGPLDRIGRAPYHVALGYHKQESMIRLLLEHGADVNQADADGSTSLHMVCKRERDVARGLMIMLIKSIDDFELTVRFDARDNSGNTPLHLALEHVNNDAAELLLERGADPNIANAEGSTCLHVVCKNLRSDYNAAEMLFEARHDNEDRPLRIDARDNLGRTPLQWAVANLKLGVLKSLLQFFGADAAKNFVFPDASYFGEQFDPKDDEDRGDIVLGLASRALAVVECLEKSGSYELDRSGVLAIATFFVKHRLFEKTAEVKRRWYDDDRNFAEKAKKKMVNPSLTLYDLIQLRAEDAAKLLTYEDYLKFGRSNKFWKLPEGPRETCAWHLCEKLARGFFRPWALQPLMELTRNELPILCCEMIVDRLGNEDLCNVCLATGNVDGCTTRVERINCIARLRRKCRGQNARITEALAHDAQRDQFATSARRSGQHDGCSSPLLGTLQKAYKYRPPQRQESVSILSRTKTTESELDDKMEIVFKRGDANPDNSITAKNTKDSDGYETQNAIKAVADEVKLKFFRDLERELVERNKRRRLDTIIACELCGKKYSSTGNLIRHIESFHCRFSHLCDKCGKTFSQRVTLKTHFATVHNAKDDTTYECATCVKKFSSKSSLERHVGSLHRGIGHSCDSCEKTFTRGQYLRSHVDKVHRHGVPTKDDRNGARYVCDACGRIFTREGNLKNHVASVHHGLGHSCDPCGKKFTRSNYLRDHVDAVHNGLIHLCDRCGKKFSSREYLRCHIDGSHEGVANTCDECGKTFATRKSLKVHVDAKHWGVARPRDTCGRESKSKGQLKRHVDAVHRDEEQSQGSWSPTSTLVHEYRFVSLYYMNLAPDMLNFLGQRLPTLEHIYSFLRILSRVTREKIVNDDGHREYYRDYLFCYFSRVTPSRARTRAGFQPLPS
ncbi:unnamed protein product, partial [Trichogramma brassicae]